MRGERLSAIDRADGFVTGDFAGVPEVALVLAEELLAAGDQETARGASSSMPRGSTRYSQRSDVGASPWPVYSLAVQGRGASRAEDRKIEARKITDTDARNLFSIRRLVVAAKPALSKPLLTRFVPPPSPAKWARARVLNRKLLLTPGRKAPVGKARS
jgi:hypothetical protein